MEVLGSFETNITVGAKTETAKFYVVKNGSKILLGKTTDIGVLKLGLGINKISDGTFPKFKDVVLTILIDKSIKPACQPYRRISTPLESKINEKIQELIKMDIIEPVNRPSSWVSPMVLTLNKSDGGVGICIEMRRANKAIIRENHPVPTMDQLITKFRKALLFSKLNIKLAFQQIELSEESRHITTFITNTRLYRYKRLMFGISCAPECFQTILERILLPAEGVLTS